MAQLTSDRRSIVTPRLSRQTDVHPPSIDTNWHARLPTLKGGGVVLRELHTSDAPSLFTFLTTTAVARFLSPPPDSVNGFERFIQWAAQERSVGKCACFAVTQPASDRAIGIFQIRSTEPGFGTAEWGFALGSPFWGSGTFDDGAALALKFAFATMGVHRLEARAAVRNGRGNRALQKLGAVQEGLLRESFARNGEHLDQVLWTILAEDHLAPVPSTPVTH